MFLLTKVAFLINDVHSYISAIVTDVLVASFALVNPVKHPRVELELAELTELGLITPVDTFVYDLLEKHQYIIKPSQQPINFDCFERNDMIIIKIWCRLINNLPLLHTSSHCY